MAVYIITGKLGGGKTLVAVGLAREALQQGRSVATNIDLNLEELLPWRTKKVRCFRLPDKLEAENFEIIGSGNDSYDEDMNGLLILDEGGLSMNSREYREKGRKEFIQWAIHSRKSGWDLAIIIQHIDGLDKQIRDFFGEHVVICSNLGRLRVPFIGWLLQMFGFKAKMPKAHKATCRYGQGRKDMVVWRKWFKGMDLYDAYDTRQKYDPNDTSGVRSMLTPWHIKGRHFSQMDELKRYLSHVWERYLNVRMGRVFVFFCASLLGGWAYASVVQQPVPAALPKQETSIEQSLNLDEVETPEPIPEYDPWETAYISSSMGNVRTNKFHYWFKNEYGTSLEVDPSWKVLSISQCAALIRTKTEKFEVFCD